MRSLVTFIPATIISLIILIIMGVYSKSGLTLYYVIILGLLEIALSFDNAVVNAKVLAKLSNTWRVLFLWVGLPIAVFGMRFIFPVLLVYWTSPLSFSKVINQAFYDPQKYSKALNAGMPLIAGFGACFLLMVFISFLFEYRSKSNPKSNPHQHSECWIGFIENSIFVRWLRGYIWSVACIGIIICIIIWILGWSILGVPNMGWSALLGLIIHQVLYFINQILGREKSSKNTFVSGLMGFCYLEILDASFSFDGVLGAFAITNDILIIFAGLAIGALYVRTMTIYLVKHDVLAKFKYLEHGAFYAIGFLAIMLFLKLFFHIPEWIVASVSILIIVIAIWHSKLEQIKENK
jgi:uncharacterized protein